MSLAGTLLFRAWSVAYTVSAVISGIFDTVFDIITLGPVEYQRRRRQRAAARLAGGAGSTETLTMSAKAAAQVRSAESNRRPGSQCKLWESSQPARDLLQEVSDLMKGASELDEKVTVFNHGANALVYRPALQDLDQATIDSVCSELIDAYPSVAIKALAAQARAPAAPAPGAEATPAQAAPAAATGTPADATAAVGDGAAQGLASQAAADR